MRQDGAEARGAALNPNPAVFLSLYILPADADAVDKGWVIL